MINIQSLDDLNNLIENGIGEDSQLEYKAGPAIENKDEIGKDISGMANANAFVGVRTAEPLLKCFHQQPCTL
jgi:hypothetical protein